MSYEPTEPEEFSMPWIVSELYRIAESVNSEVKTIHHAAPAKLIAGLEVIADGINWDPLSLSGSTPYAVLYNGVAWQAI